SVGGGSGQRGIAPCGRSAAKRDKTESCSQLQEWQAGRTDHRGMARHAYSMPSRFTPRQPAKRLRSGVAGSTGDVTLVDL
ncbi:hypothetical protein, partial [Xanthomonas perforans]|uniref:hypothetical protein n=1 Tax=Xanthomonas perforans TaxID=442694 RepID=UPI001F34FACE